MEIIIIIALVVGFVIYKVVDRICEHKEEMRELEIKAYKLTNSLKTDDLDFND